MENNQGFPTIVFVTHLETKPWSSVEFRTCATNKGNHPTEAKDRPDEDPWSKNINKFT